jgi:hypothetical protein
MYECLSKEQILLMPLTLAQGSNKAERLPAFDTGLQLSVVRKLGQRG